MPLRTITAEIDGKVRKIKADIPDGATNDDIIDAVSSFLAQPAQQGGGPKTAGELGLVPLPPGLGGDGGRAMSFRGNPKDPRTQNHYKESALSQMAAHFGKTLMGIPAMAAEQMAGGLDEAGQGVAALTRPGVDAKAGAASRIVRGLGSAAAPIALPAALVAAPVATLAAIPAGMAAAKAGSAAAEFAGAGPGVSDLAGDVAGIVGGGYAAKGGQAVQDTLPGALRALKAASTKPGALDVLAGGAEALGGAGTVVAGHPAYGAGAVIDGIRRVRRGMAASQEAGVPVDVPPSLVEAMDARLVGVKSANDAALAKWIQEAPEATALAKMGETAPPVPLSENRITPQVSQAPSQETIRAYREANPITPDPVKGGALRQLQELRDARAASAPTTAPENAATATPAPKRTAVDEFRERRAAVRKTPAALDPEAPAPRPVRPRIQETVTDVDFPVSTPKPGPTTSKLASAPVDDIPVVSETAETGAYFKGIQRNMKVKRYTAALKGKVEAADLEALASVVEELSAKKYATLKQAENWLGRDHPAIPALRKLTQAVEGDGMGEARLPSKESFGRIMEELKTAPPARRPPSAADEFEAWKADPEEIFEARWRSRTAPAGTVPGGINAGGVGPTPSQLKAAGFKSLAEWEASPRFPKAAKKSTNASK
jgi:hypothetical protein